MDLSTTFASIRKQVAALSVVALVTGLFATGVATAATGKVFSDVPADAWFAPYVNGLTEQGVIDSTQNSYRPADLVNRAEMAKLAFKVSGLPLEKATEAPYKDVAMGTWYTDYVYTLTKNGIVSGDKKDGVPTGFFRPQDSLNRAEASKMLVNSAQMAENLSGAPHFPDVTSSAWYYNYVETLFNHGVVAGYPDGKFRPGNNINRAEVAKMVFLSMNPAKPGFKLSSAAAASATKVELIFSKNVEKASAEKFENYNIEDSSGNKLDVTAATVASGDTVHLTTKDQTKGKTYYVTVKNIKSADGDDLSNLDAVSFLGYGADVSGGPLTVSLSSQTPVAGSVPQGATGVTFTCWDFKAGAEAVTLKSLKVNRVGPGSETAFSDVYLYRGDERITTGRSINSDSQNVEFSNINQKLAANENAKICLVADIEAVNANGGVHAFQLASADAVVSNSSNMTGSFPMRGADQLITTAVVGTSTVTKNGVLDEITIGQKDARVAQFQISAGASEDQALQRLSLYFRGSVRPSSLTNLKLFVEGEATALATTSAVGQKDLATFTLAKPFKIGRGENKVFYVTADIAGARTGETIKAYFDEATDVYIKGLTYGYGTGVDINGYDGDETTPTTGDFSYAVLKGSKFTMDFKGPAAGDMAVSQKQARCLDVNLTNSAGLDVTIKDWEVKLDILPPVPGPGAADGLINTAVPPAVANYSLIKLVKLNDDGTVAGTLLGPGELDVAGGDVTQTVKLKGSTNIASGETVKAAVVFDVANNPAIAISGNQIKCTLLAPTGADQVKDSNNDQLGAENITPNTGIPGNVMTLVESALKLSSSGTLKNKTYTKGAKDVSLFVLDLKSGTTSDTKLSTLNLKVEEAVTPNVDVRNYMNSISIYDGSTLLKGPVNITNVDVANSDGDIIFTGLNVTVPKGTTKTLTVKGNVDPTIAVEQKFDFFVNSALATDGSGSTINPDITDVNAVGKGSIITLTPNSVPAVTAATVSTAESLVTTGDSKPTGLKFGVKVDVGEATLKDFTIKVKSPAIPPANLPRINTVSVYTGTNCDTPVANAQNVTVNSTTDEAKVTNADIKLSTSSTFVCVKTNANELDSTTPAADEALEYQLELSTIEKIHDSSGNNIAPAPIAITGTDEFAVYSSAPTSITLDDLTNESNIEDTKIYSNKKIGNVVLDVKGGDIKLNSFNANVTASYSCEMRKGSKVYKFVGGQATINENLNESKHTYEVWCSKAALPSGKAEAIDLQKIDFDTETGHTVNRNIKDITRNDTNSLAY